MQQFLYIFITALGSIMLLLGCIWLIATKSTWFRKKRIAMLAFVGIFAMTVYVVGFISDGTDPWHLFYSGLMGLFSMGRVFVLENDFGMLGSYAANPVFRAAFALMCVAGLVTTSAIAIGFIGYVSVCRIRLQFIRIFGRLGLGSDQMAIFSTISKASLLLADNLKSRHTHMLIIFLLQNQSEDEPLLKQVTEKNYLLLKTDLIRESAGGGKDAFDFDRLGLYPALCDRQIQLFLMEEDPHKNYHIAHGIAKALQLPGDERVAQLRTALYLYAFVDSLYFDAIFTDTRVKEDFDGLHFYPVDRNEVTVQELFSRISLFSDFRGTMLGDGCANGELNVLSVGGSALDKALWQYIANVAQAPGLKLRIIAAAEDVNASAASFLYENPQLSDCMEFTAMDAPIASQRFFELLAQWHGRIDYAFITGTDNSRNMQAAQLLLNSQQLQERMYPICIQLGDADKFEEILNTSLYAKVVCFARLGSIYTEEILINEKLDMQAQAVHAYYRSVCAADAARSEAAAGKEASTAFDAAFNDKRWLWERQTIFDRNSSRASAEHIRTKLTLLGLSEKDIRTAEEWEARLRRSPELLETLAQGEHLRWNAFHLTRGWRTLPLEEYERCLKDTGLDRLKDTSAKRHLSLIDWARILQYDALFPSLHNRKKDETMVYNMAKTLLVNSPKDIDKLCAAIKERFLSEYEA